MTGIHYTNNKIISYINYRTNNNNNNIIVLCFFLICFEKINIIIVIGNFYNKLIKNKV